MNPTNQIEDRLNEVGQQLRARPTLVEEVKRQLEMECAAIQLARREPPVDGRRRRHRRLAFSGLLILAMAVLLWSIFMAPNSSVAWTQVADAVRKQRWLHGQTVFQDGERGQMWISAEDNLWAYEIGRSRIFFDGRQRAKFELSEKQDSIQILPLGEEEHSHVLPMKSLADEIPAFSWLFGTEKVTHQRQRNVEEKGRQWIEFELKLARGELRQATLRVDPETRLPVRLVLAASNESSKSIQWDFDYPASGPSDIYAMGVNRDLPRIDLRPDATSQRIVDAVSASRKRIENFQMLVSSTQGFVGYAVWRSGDRWKVDLCYLMKLHGKPWPTTPVEDSKYPSQWFDEQIAGSERVPLYVCDGKSVWKNRSAKPGAKATWELSSQVAPVDLMSGEGMGSLAGAVGIKFPSLLYPDLSRKSGWEFGFDAAPKGNPGLVVVKRAARLAMDEPQVGHEWYYVDPARGHAVVKAELFTVPVGQPVDPDSTILRQTITMNDLTKSANGSWYAKSVDNRVPVKGRKNGAVSGRIETVTHYHLIFDPKFPEGFFESLVEE